MEVQTTIKNDAITKGSVASTPCLVKITPAKRKANKKYYETHKESVIEYVKEYNYNRRQNDNTYREKINSYYKSKYDDEAKQKKREYYLKRKQQTQTQ